MNRYVQLCEANAEAIRNLVGRKTECAKFAVRLVESLIEFGRLPYQNVRMFNLNQGFDPRRPCSASHAMVLDDSGFWRAGLAVAPRQTPLSAATAAKLQLWFKKERNFFAVRIQRREPEYRVQPKARAQMRHLCEAIMEAVQEQRRAGHPQARAHAA